MPDLETELNELKGFIAALKADRAAVKEKEKREAWTKYVSLTIVIIAVFAAIATQWAGKFSSRTLAKLNDATFYQAKASDQWSYYQAKSIKQNLYEVSRGQLHTNAEPGAAELLKDFEDKIAKYEKDNADITAEAKQQEKSPDEAREAATLSSKLSSEMGPTVSLFSVAIAMPSICLVTKKKPLWFVAMALAALALGKLVLVWMH